VIDFDSVGELGKAEYPQILNERIPWPGGPGQLISWDDDVTLLYVRLASNRRAGFEIEIFVLASLE
jgi:hypothetical protein